MTGSEWKLIIWVVNKEKKMKYNYTGFDTAVIVEENGNEVILFQREEGSWLRMAKKVYENICWHFKHQEIFDHKYDTLLARLDEYHMLAHRTQKRLENITLMLTNTCNLNCKHCCASEISASQDISFQILRQTIALGSRQITVTGGEPLLHKRIREILAFLKQEYKGTLVLATNGTLVEDYLDLILTYVDKVEISIDGVDDKDTEKYRGRGVFQKVLDAVQMLKQHDIPVAMSLVSYDGSKKEKFIHLNEHYGTVPIIRELYLNDRVLSNINEIVPQGREGYIQILRDSMKLEPEHMDCFPCGAVSYQIFVDCEGNVYPCGGLAENALKIGNIQDKAVYDKIANNPEACYEAVTEKLLAEEKFSKCRNCNVRCFCWNCISNVLSRSALPEVFEAYCENSLRKWKRFVWEERK